MRPMSKSTVAAVVVAATACTPVFAAGIPVFDAALNTQTTANQVDNIAKLVAQLEQMRAHVAAITGNRGMGNLLSGQNRSYLPADWHQAMDLLNNNRNGYAELTNAAQTIKTAQAVLSNADLDRLSPEMKHLLDQARNASASQQALGQAAYKQSSERVTLLQQLLSAINGTTDAKAVMDLQARIGAEQTMLQNEQTKLQNIAQLQQAQDLALRQMKNEMRVRTSGSGTFPDLDISVDP